MKFLILLTFVVISCQSNGAKSVKEMIQYSTDSILVEELVFEMELTQIYIKTSTSVPTIFPSASNTS